MTYFNSYYIMHPYIQHWLIYWWQIYRYVNGTKLAFHYMIISLEPFFRKIASFPLFAMRSSAIDIFSIPYCRASFFLFFVRYKIRSPEVNIQLLLLCFFIISLELHYIEKSILSKMVMWPLILQVSMSRTKVEMQPML